MAPRALFASWPGLFCVEWIPGHHADTDNELADVVANASRLAGDVVSGIALFTGPPSQTLFMAQQPLVQAIWQSPAPMRSEAFWERVM